MLAIADEQAVGEAWSAEVDLVLSALDAGGLDGAWPAVDRRRAGARVGHRTAAVFSLFSERGEGLGHTLFTRDINGRGMGFITRRQLPLGYGGVVRWMDEDGAELEEAGTVSRCRATGCGWYEGSLTFKGRQATGW